MIKSAAPIRIARTQIINKKLISSLHSNTFLNVKHKPTYNQIKILNFHSFHTNSNTQNIILNNLKLTLNPVPNIIIFTLSNLSHSIPNLRNKSKDKKRELESQKAQLLQLRCVASSFYTQDRAYLDIERAVNRFDKLFEVPGPSEGDSNILLIVVSDIMEPLPGSRNPYPFNE